MEKKGIIEAGITPPETEGEKSASPDALEQHITKRAADAVQGTCREQEEKLHLEE